MSSLILPLLSSPASIMIFVLELGLGAGLGYFSAKILKYLLALIAIFAVGVFLNIWQAPQLGANITSQLSQLGLTWSKISPVVMDIVLMLGLTTVLPITIGFILGLIIALFK